MLTSSHPRPATDRTASIATDRRRRRMSGGAGALLAAALLLALPASIGAQTRALVTSTIEATVNEKITGSNPSTLPNCTVTVPNPASTACTYTVRLSTVPTGPVTVRVESSDTIVATVKPESLMFTADDWSGTKTLTISAKNDEVANLGGARFGTIKHTPSGGGFSQSKIVHVTIQNEDNIGVTYSKTALEVTEGKVDTTNNRGPEATYTVKLNTEPTGPVTITLVSEDVTVATVSPGKLVFTDSNWDDPQTVTVTGVNDGVDNPASSTPSNTRATNIKHTFSGGGYDSLSETKVAVTVYDEARTTDKIVVAPSTIGVKENGRTTYSVVLNSPPSGSVRVALAIDPVAGSANIDVDPTFLTFGTSKNPWDTPQTVTVIGADDKKDNNPSDDDDIADTRSATIKYTPTGGGYDNPSPEATTTVTVADNEDAQIIVPSSKNVTEGNEVDYQVRLSSMPSTDLVATVEIATGDGRDHAGVALSSGATSANSVTLTFTPTNWDTSQTVYVVGKDDNVDNSSPREATITHSATGYGSSQKMRVRVTDDGDKAGLTITGFPSELSDATSDSRDDTYTVTLNTHPGDADVVVAVTSSDPTVTVTGKLTFATSCTHPCSDQVTISIPDESTTRVDNPWVSKNVTITHDPSGSGNYNTAPTVTKTLKVIDSDTASTLSLPSSVTVTEGATTGIRYVVTLPEPAANSVTVSLSAVSIIAYADSSNEENPSFGVAKNLDFSVGESKKTVWIFGQNDYVDNAGGSRSAIIQNTASGYLRKDVPVTVYDNGDTAGIKILSLEDKPITSITIEEESAGKKFTVELTSAPPTGKTVTVHVVSADPDVTVSPSELTFNSTRENPVPDTPCVVDSCSWNHPIEVTVTGGDDADGDDKSTSVTLTSVGGGYDSVQAKSLTIKVEDNDRKGLVGIPEGEYEVTEGQSPEISTIKLDTSPTAGKLVTVSIRSANSRVVTVKPSSLTFSTANWDTAQAVTITGVADAGSKDRFATITFSPSGGGYGSSQNESLRVKVANDETARLIVDPALVTVDEGSTATYKVSLNSDPVAPVIVRVSATDAVEVSPESLTFKPGKGKTPQTVTVTGKDDQGVVDGTATITHSSSSEDGDYEGLSASVQVTVTDDDATVAVSKSSVTVPEAGGTARYTVKLDGQPTDDVTVKVTSSNPSIATVSPGSLTFTPSNWNTPRRVTVTGVDDSSPGGSRSVTITHTASGGGYDETAVPSVSVSVTDDDGMVVSPTVVTVDEAGGTKTYRVSLNTQPTGTVTVDVASSDPDAATARPPSLTFTPGNWAAQTVTVTGVNDDRDNGASRSATITNTPSGAGYSSSNRVTVAVTVTDDEDPPTLAISGGEATEGNPGTQTPLRFTVIKSGGTDQVVTVAYADAGRGTATAGTDYTAVPAGTLTFAANEGSKIITVMVRGDDVSEPDETVVLALSSPSKATFPGGQATVMATGTIVDDDASRLSIEARAPRVEEGEPLIFTVVLDPPIANEQVTVEVDTGGTATAGTDYTGVPEILTFAAGEAAKTITVAVVDDADYEPDETVVIALRNPRPQGDVVIEVGEAETMIEDNDEPPALSISGTSVAEGNDGTTSKLTFKVTKSGGTSMEATVAYADAGTGTATAGTDYTAVPAGTLTFAPEETTKTITVVVKGDDESEGNETVVIRLSRPSNAMLAEGKGAATGTIIDDDTLPRVATDWLARFGRTAAGATLDAIARRMNDVPADAEPSITVAGHRAAFAPEPVAQAATVPAAPWEEGWTRALTIEELANGSSFDAGSDFVAGLNVWGATSYNQFEMTPQGSYTLDGSLVSAILGVDHQGDTHVAGLALAYHGGGGEFGGIGKTEGSLGTNLYSVHPYVRLTFGEVFHVGGSFGLGTGDLSITDKDGDALVETGVGMPVLAAVDARVELSLAEAWILALQADGHLVQIVADEQLPRFTRVETNTHRLRLVVENSYVFLVGDGVSLAPVLETGLRYDGGDAVETGLGLDIGGRLRLDATVVGLMVDARGHASLNNWGEGQEQAPTLRDWGLGGVIRWRPAGGGMGPEMSLAPAYGGVLGAAEPSLSAEIGYRVSAFGGVLTPYSSAEFGGGGQRGYSAGARFAVDRAVELNAEGTYLQPPTGDAEQFLTLRVRLQQ